MKIAIVAQHATPCTRAPVRARARTTPDPAAACGSCTSRPARPASGVTRNCWPAYPRSVTRCGPAGAVSGLMSCTPSRWTLRAPRPDGYPRSRHPGCAGIQLAWRRGAAGPRQRGPSHAAASQAPAGAGHGPARTVFAGAVTKTARLLASKGPQSMYVRNS
jgi:hypothetical protein